MSSNPARSAQEESADQQQLDELLDLLHKQLDNLAQSIIEGADMIIDEQLSQIRWAIAVPAGSRTAEEQREHSQRAEQIETLRLRLVESHEQYNTQRLEIDQIQSTNRGNSSSSTPQHSGDRRSSFGTASLRQAQTVATRQETNNALQQHAGLIGTLDADRNTFVAENQARPEYLTQRMGDQGPGVPVPFHETREYARQTARRLAEERYAEELRLQATHRERLGDQGPGSPIHPQNHQRRPAAGALPPRVHFQGNEIYQANIRGLNEEVQVLARAAQFLRHRMMSQRQTQQPPDPRLEAGLYAVESASRDAQNQLAMAQNASVSRQPRSPITFNEHLHGASWRTSRSILPDVEDMQVSRSLIDIEDQSSEWSFQEARLYHQDLRDILEEEEDDQDTESQNHPSRRDEVD